MIYEDSVETKYIINQGFLNTFLWNHHDSTLFLSLSWGSPSPSNKPYLQDLSQLASSLLLTQTSIIFAQMATGAFD